MGASIDSDPLDQARRGHRRRARRSRMMSEINVTPFVDVMLVLLIIFMVAAPLLTVGVPVDLPETKSDPLPGQDEPLAVSIAPDRRIYVQDTEVGLAELVPLLMRITENNTDVRIFLRADKAVDYGFFMEVMSALNQAGFSRIGLVTESKTEGGSSEP